MDKLTAIRIKYPNGSYSSPIYISVEAANVRYNDVQNIVDVVDSLSARVTAIASMAEGSTTGDAQLVDARTGFDGITYNSAGDAVRANDEKNTQLVLVKDTQPTETWNKLWLDTSDADEQRIISTDDMANIVAAYYDEEEDYAVGDYVIHEDVTTGVGKLYKCKTAISGGETWTAAHWNETIITEDYNNQINDLKSALTNVSYASLLQNKSSFLGTSAFVQTSGILNDGTIGYLYKSRVTNYTILHTINDLKIEAKTGFRFYVVYYQSDGTFINSTSFNTSYTIPGDSYFRILIARSTEDASEIANVTEFLNAVTFYTITGELIEENKYIKNSINHTNTNGLQTFLLYGNFQHYGLNPDGTFKTDQLYRVSNNDPMTFAEDLKVHVASGFQWGYIPFVNGVAGSWSGWKTSDFTIPANTSFVVQIARTTGISEIANVIEFCNAVTFDTVVSKNTKEINDINSIIRMYNGVVSISQSDVVDNTFVYGDSGVESSSNNYICTNYIELPPSYNGKIYFKSSLVSGAGFAFFNSFKTYISGVGGNNASTYGYQTGTEKRVVNVPNNAKYIRVSLSKTDYTGSTDFNINYPYENTIKRNAVSLSATDFEYGTFNSNGLVVAAPTNGTRVVSKFVKVCAKDRIATTVNAWVFEYDNNFNVLRNSGAWVQAYNVVNDGYVRLQYQTGSKSAAASATTIYSTAEVYNENLAENTYVAKQLPMLWSKSYLPGLDIADNAGSTQSGYPHVVTIAHRGFQCSAPENTIPAFIMTRRNGIYSFETDVQFTSDGVPVMLHDSTVDRTSDGSGTLTEMTFDAVRELDFGSWKSADFTGTQIPTLEETFDCARKLGMQVQLELKQPSGGFTQAQFEVIFDLVRKYNMIDKMTWAGFISEEQFQVVLSEFPTATVILSNLSQITSTVIDNAIALKTNENEVIVSTDIATNNDQSLQLVVDSGFPLQLAFVNTDERILSAHPYATYLVTDGTNANNVLYKSLVG